MGRLRRAHEETSGPLWVWGRAAGPLPNTVCVDTDAGAMAGYVLCLTHKASALTAHVPTPGDAGTFPSSWEVNDQKCGARRCTV